MLLFTAGFCPACFAQKGQYPVWNFSPADYKAGIQNIGFAQNRDMSLFVANNLGILSYNGNEWKQHALNTGKKHRSLAFDDKSNRLYAGSQGDFGFFEEDWNYISLSSLIPEAHRSFDDVWSIHLLDSKVYFSTFQSIFEYDGSSIRVIQHKDGLNRTYSANNRLYTQTPEGRILEISDGNLISPYPQNTSDIISGIIPYENGLLLFYNSGSIEFTSSEGADYILPEFSEKLKGTYVNDVIALGSNQLVVTTQQAGLFIFDIRTGTVENISTREGLQSNACLNTFQDFDGNLWVGMQNGIALIDINSAARFVNREINLPGSGYETYETTEGTYFTTSNGIYFLAPDAPECLFLAGTEGPAYGITQIGEKLYAGHHTGLFLLENGQAQKLATTEGLWKIR